MKYDMDLIFIIVYCVFEFVCVWWGYVDIDVNIDFK